MNNKVPTHKFAVKNGRLTYDGFQVGDSVEVPGFKTLEIDEKPLGEGKNGVVYRVRNKELDQSQVLKVFKVDTAAQSQVREKAVHETRKNAELKLSGIVVVPHAAGEYLYPAPIRWSLMPLVEHGVTLSHWLQLRKAELDYYVLKAKKSNVSPGGYTSWVQWLVASLDVANGYISAMADLHSRGFQHGDAHARNVFVLPETSDEGRGLTAMSPPAHPLFSDAPRPVKLFDLGTSQMSTMGATISNARENIKMLEVLSKLLKPFVPFEGPEKISGKHSWLNVWLDQSATDELGVPRILRVEDDATTEIMCADLSKQLRAFIKALTIKAGFLHSGTKPHLGDLHELELLQHIACLVDWAKAEEYLLLSANVPWAQGPANT